MKIKKSPVFIFIFLMINLRLVAEPAETSGVPLQALSTEAPKSFIATQLGSADVELFVQGYWEAALASSGTFSFGSPSPALFNPVPLFFRQQPDLYISLILQKQWWAEISVSDDISRTLFALGYSGLENDFLKEVRLGNSGISMRNYPNMAFGTTKNAFGIRAQASDLGKGITADAMIRWDSLSYTTKRFFGTLALEENVYPAAAWLRGRRFVLLNAPVTNLVLREVYNGNARILGTEEYALKNATGFIELKSEPAGVLYADFNDTVGPHANIKLYEKITLISSPDFTEAKNLYAITAGSASSDYFVRSRKTNLPDSSYSIRIVSPTLLEITKGDNPPYTLADFTKPFSSSDPWIYEAIPANTETEYPPAASFELASRSFKETSGIQIEQNAVAGSISILRNGISTTLFSYDPASGAIDLSPPPGAGEDITVRYALESSLKGSNGLVFGFGMGWQQGEIAQWQAAIGGRWPFPGQSYAEAGQQHPSWLGITLAAESLPEPKATFSWSSSLFGRLVRPEASGIYRIAGMENEPDYLSPFRQVSGDTVNIASKALLDASFPAAWPDYDKKVHAQNEKSLSLRFIASGASGAASRFINYQEQVPLSLYKRFVFFMRNESAAGLASLTLHVGDESSGLTINNLDIVALPNEWVRVEVSLDAIPQILVTNSSGEIITAACGSISYSDSASAGFVYIELANLASGTVWIDELHLEDPYAGFDSEYKGFVQFRSPDTPEDVFANARVTAAVGSATLDQWAFSLNSDIGAGFYTGPARWRFNVMPQLLNDSFDMGVSYSFMLPRSDFPLRVSEQFSRHAGNQLFAHKLQASLAAAPFQASLTAEALDNKYLFSQTWLASLDLPSWFSLTVNAKNYLPFSMLGTLSIPETWVESWKFLMPEKEGQASKRSLGAVVLLAPLSAISLSANQHFDSKALTESMAGGKVALPIKISTLAFTPFYERKLQVFYDSIPASFSQDAALWLGSMQNCLPLVIEYPFQELFKPALGARFQELVGIYDKADYSTGTGLGFERPIGFGSLDLWVPAKTQVGISRQLQKVQDNYTDSLTFALTLDGSAFNVFSRSGAVPLFTSFDLDEYFWKLDAKLQSFSTDAQVFPSLGGEYSAALSTEMGSSLAAALQWKFAETRSATAWEAGGRVSYNKKAATTWLAELMQLTRVKEGKARDPNDAGKINVVWNWFDGIASKTPVLRDIWSAELRVNYKENEAAPYAIQASERYETKYTIAQSLSIAVYASLSESIGLYSNYVLWGFGYELGMSARVSF